MKQSLGLIEVRGLAASVYIADVMIKTANVKLLSLEKTNGIGWIVIKITGNVGAVNAAINSGKQASIEKNEFVTCKVIPRPADLTEDLFCTEAIKEKKESKKDSRDEIFQEKVSLKKLDEKEDNTKAKENNIQAKKNKKTKNNLTKDIKKNNGKVEKKEEK